MTRQDFEKWLKKVGVHFDTVGGYNWKLGAETAFNLLSKEISEKDEEIKVLKEQLLGTTHHLNRILEDTEKAFRFGKNGYSWEQFNRLKDNQL